MESVRKASSQDIIYNHTLDVNKNKGGNLQESEDWRESAVSCKFA